MLPDPSSIDPAMSYVINGTSYKEMVVILHAVNKMTNNAPNDFSRRTVNVCIQNTVYKIDVIGTEPRLGL
jgi:hypothetical protein